MPVNEATRAAQKADPKLANAWKNKAGRDLSEPESHALNARLVLLLANHIGSQAVLLEALQAARLSGRKEATPS